MKLYIAPTQLVRCTIGFNILTRNTHRPNSFALHCISTIGFTVRTRNARRWNSKECTQTEFKGMHTDGGWT